MSLFAAYLLVTRLQTSSVPYDGSVAAYLATGLLVVAVSWPMVTEAGKYPTAIRVSQIGLVLIMGPAHPLRELHWQDPRMKLGLIDRRGLPPARPDGTPRNPFALQVGRSPWIPISAEAFNAILVQANEHGLRLSRKVVQATRGPGTYEELLIRCGEK